MTYTYDLEILRRFFTIHQAAGSYCPECGEWSHAETEPRVCPECGEDHADNPRILGDLVELPYDMEPQTERIQFDRLRDLVQFLRDENLTDSEGELHFYDPDGSRELYDSESLRIGRRELKSAIITNNLPVRFWIAINNAIRA